VNIFTAGWIHTLLVSNWLFEKLAICGIREPFDENITGFIIGTE
jgi:hypothetical protein